MIGENLKMGGSEGSAGEKTTSLSILPDSSRKGCSEKVVDFFIDIDKYLL